MALASRYVDKKGQVNEPFIGLVRVGDTSAKSLKEAILSLLMKHSLSPSKIRGQGYDGASNMQGKMNGLKALILQETPSAHCIHCSAHQLQLTLVAVAKKHKEVETFFAIVANVLLMSNELSKALQKKEQDIANAMIFLDLTKERLQQMKNEGWKSLMDEVSLFCAKHDILVPNMEEFYIPGKSKRRPSSVTYSHHLCVGLFYTVIYLQLQELKSRFDVVSGNLLLGMASLNPANSFANFDKERIITLAKYYPDEFGELKLRDLSHQLDTFIWHMKHGDPRFSDLKGIGDLAKALVEENLVETYSLVYLLVKLTLILFVASATVERAFSSMKYIKDELRSSIGDAFLNDCLVCYFEKEVFANVSIDVIIDRFQSMRTRRVHV
uniref:DUF4371 domain-containing protein n=1 Tax=Nicotiana tabacum TaxID=4097 RepID=A0A1S3XZ89_TOBAC|nr:PREDICTED: uncharacterized protein LOC107770466 [Nicotiana tabacum]